MAKQFDRLALSHRSFIAAQHIFFVGTAARQIVELTVDLAQTSCGFGVPTMTYTADRPDAEAWSAEKGPDGIRTCWGAKNRTTFDGLATGIEANP